MLDPIDRKILQKLVENARISVSDLARHVNLSKTPVAARLRAMETSGLIMGYRALISPRKLGRLQVSFMEVKLTDTREAALNAFNTAVRKVTAVEECYMIAGGFDYLLKIRSRNMDEYRHIMAEEISALPHVASTSTYVAMEAVVENAKLPLE